MSGSPQKYNLETKVYDHLIEHHRVEWTPVDGKGIAQQSTVLEAMKSAERR
jgi:hypothetical protein